MQQQGEEHAMPAEIWRNSESAALRLHIHHCVQAVMRAMLPPLTKQEG